MTRRELMERMTDLELSLLIAQGCTCTCSPEVPARHTWADVVAASSSWLLLMARKDLTLHGVATLWLRMGSQGSVVGVECIPQEWQGFVDHKLGTLSVNVPFSQDPIKVNVRDLAHANVRDLTHVKVYDTPEGKV